MTLASGSGGAVALDSLLGLSVGDALGARWEGAPFDAGRAGTSLTFGQDVARWTDDTQMAAAVLEVLLEAGTIEPDLLARAFGRRYEPWRGYGRGMHALLPELRDGGDWRLLSTRIFPGGSFGNGSAMRVAPLGAYFHGQPLERVRIEAERSAQVTHAHPEAIAGAVATAIASWAAARSREGPAPAVVDLWRVVQASVDPALDLARGLAAAAALPTDAPLADAVAALGNGSRVTCMDTVPLALWISLGHLDAFAVAIRTAIAAGGDTDTVAAIVGGIVAARVGADRIPERWRAAVEPLPVG